MLEEIPLSRPDIEETDIQMVVRAMRSGRLALGPMQRTFEGLVAARAGRTHGVACSSGTAGLHMALIALGIGPGDEVITTPFSFIASANCILYVGATPVFVDIEPRSLNMCPDALEAAITPRTKAIVAVEAFGNPRHMDRYRGIADKHEIRLIEDACEGLGGRCAGRDVGSFGHVAVFGFYPNKQITTGEGGVVVTDDDRVADVCRSLANQGRPTLHGPVTAAVMDFERLGYNYRMSELQAALGISQIHRLDDILERREAVARRYFDRFLDHPDLILPDVDDRVFMSWFVFVVRLSDRYGAAERNRIIDGMRRHDVGAAAYFPCIHLQPHFREGFGFVGGEFPVAESVAQRTIALPFYTGLTERDAGFAAQTLELMISRENLSRS